MADDDTSTDETVESPTVDAAPVTPDPVTAEPVTEQPVARVERTGVDRRSLGIGAGAVGALVLAFLAGLAIGGHHDRGGRFEQARDGRGGFMQRGDGGRGDMRGGGMRGGGMPGGEMRGGDARGGFGGGPGARDGRGHGGGGAGVVESASDDELTISPLGGRIEELTVNLDDDTEVTQRGDDGARDVEDAAVSDIDEGDIVMVLGEPADNEDGDDEDADTTATIDATAVIILRDGDE